MSRIHYSAPPDEKGNIEYLPGAIFATAEDLGRIQVQIISGLIGGEEQIAILSATSTAPNQNEWIEWMKDELTKPEYANIELVATVYGHDEDEKSYNEALGLMGTYPDLKGIISPTTFDIDNIDDFDF